MQINEQKREFRNKATHVWSTYFLMRVSRIYNGERQASSIKGVGKTGQPHVKQ